MRKRNHLNIWGGVVFLVMMAGVGFLLAQKTESKTLAETITKLPNVITQAGKPAGINFTVAGPKFSLPGAKWVPQTFNNCGPATTSMALQYFGYTVSQEETKKALRTNPKDSNVFTFEIGEYLRKQYNIESRLMFNGNMAILKTLVTNGFYIIIEDWLHPNEDIGHNTIIRGYDDDLGVFIGDDPFTGVGVKYKYTDFDEGQWKPFNREYMPIYKKDKEELLKAIIGENWDTKIMYQNSIKTNELALKSNRKDMYAWFNLGTSYYALGQYSKAKEAFETSQTIGWPMRMLWYQYQPVQTYNKLGDHKKALETANIGLKTFEAYPELHLESAIAYKGLGDLASARKEAQRALELAPNWEPVKTFLKSL